MSKFFAAKNLVSTAMALCVPWEFKATENITPLIRGDKEERQRWYKTVSTQHQFYSGIEPVNPNLRVSRQENPPLYIHALAADYDLLKLSEERVLEAVSQMTLKPSWMEKSLGGNWRLVWLFETPMLVGDYDFCTSVLQKAVAWLQLNRLPELDQKAFETPTRLLCNGCEWKDLGHPPVPAQASQAFLVRCASEFSFKGAGDSANVPLDAVEKALKEKYPAFNWPQDFSDNSQGPTFWIPESTSPLSAIVKSGGMVTFSAHAEKPFYTWADLLGADFVKDFTEKSVSKATENVWWDGKFWRLKHGVFASEPLNVFTNYLKVNCKLSGKADKDGSSPMEKALQYIYDNQDVVSAVPFVFQRQGLRIYQGKRVLNTYASKPVEPAAGKQEWGVSFPFIAWLIDNIFCPVEPQKWHFLAWHKHYYTSAYLWTPAPGQNLYLFGGVGIGKTLLNRLIVGVSVGGFVDASKYLIDNEAFNSHLLENPHWCMDDESPSSFTAQANVAAAMKKLAGNHDFLHNKKFEVAGMTEWMGRGGVTANLDFISLRIAAGLDNSSMDKTHLFRCVKEMVTAFPERSEVARMIQQELPFYLRWLLDWTPPDFVERDRRFGYMNYQEETILTQTRQAGPVAPFKELLMDTLNIWFRENPTADKFTGTGTDIMRMMTMNPLNEHILRSLKIEQASRYLEQVAKEGVLKCEASTGQGESRVWTFPRDPQTQPKPPAGNADLPPAHSSTPGGISFQK